MKELSIKEKAKAYDEALERAKRLYEQGTITESLSYVFPQLKKLGDGEVRKEIMQLIQGMHDADPRKERWLAWLEKQGEPTDINPSEFDLHLNKLLKQFETLPKEELASSLSFYLNVVQNDGTYREEKQGEQKPQRMISAEAKEAMYGKPAWSEKDEYIIERLSYLLDNEQENYPQLSCDFQEIQEFKDWLKSLKQRIKL